MSVDSRWRVERAASDLAQLLRMAQRFIAETKPHVCCDCGHLFVADAGRRCARCEHARPSNG